MYSTNRLFLANPAYFGGKRKHFSFVFGHLAQQVPRQTWPNLLFIDAFLGGGAISTAAKALGFKGVYANDWSERSQIIAKAVLQNQNQLLGREDCLWLCQPLPVNAGLGIAESVYCQSVLDSRHAKAIDQWYYWAKKVQNSLKQALLCLLIWHSAYEFVCFPTSFGTSNRPYAEALDGLRSWDDLNPKRYTDGSFIRLLKPTLEVLETKRKVINKGIFSGSPCQVYQMDAIPFIQQIQGDIAYFDPPYPGTLCYEKSYAVLDHLLTGQPSQHPPSAFSNDTEALDALLKASNHIPIWVLSYGNRHLELDELVNLVKRHAGLRQVVGFAKPCKHLAHVSKNANNQELLIIATPERKVISYAH